MLASTAGLPAAPQKINTGRYKRQNQQRGTTPLGGGAPRVNPATQFRPRPRIRGPRMCKTVRLSTHKKRYSPAALGDRTAGGIEPGLGPRERQSGLSSTNARRHLRIEDAPPTGQRQIVQGIRSSSPSRDVGGGAEQPVRGSTTAASNGGDPNDAKRRS